MSSSNSSSKRDYVRIANDYARKVVAGRIPACHWVKRACQRHLDDLKRTGKDWHFVFDGAAAERACQFVELMPYTKGKWAKPERGKKTRPKIRLSPWQIFITCILFGWLEKERQPDGRRLRRFTLAYINVPRKNGKSEWVAALGLYMLALDGEVGSEVYCGATNEKQAWAVFRPARDMAKSSPQFLHAFGVQVGAESIFMPKNGSRFQPIIGNPGDGDSPHCAIVDEYHEHKTDALFDTMRTGMGAREQPLTIVITTAGFDIAGPCFAMQLEIQAILDGVVKDERTFGIIYSIDKDDDWTTVEAAIKANPNFGVSVLSDYLEQQRQSALRNPRKQNIYKTKHLNLWVQSGNPWMDMQQWQACADKKLTEDSFLREEVYMGIDVGNKFDISSVAKIFRKNIGGKTHYYLFARHYVPQTCIEAPENEHYRAWLNGGHIVETEGNACDYFTIESDILADNDRFDIYECGFDSWNAAQLGQRLMGNSIKMIEVPMTPLRLSEPMKELQALVLDGRLHHAGDPVLEWMVSNVTCKIDNNDNIFPRKAGPDKKIDGAVAAIVAIGRAILNAEEQSDFDSPSIIFV